MGRRGARAAAAAPARGPALLGAGWKDGPRRGGRFPWSVPALRALDAGLALDAPVTFFVGENGSGKSTLLEAIALAAGVRAVGSERDPWRDPTLAAQRELAGALRLAWRWRPSSGFFLRAEDFGGHLRARARLDARLAREGAAGDGRGAGAAADAGGGAQHPDELAAGEYVARYDARSHGESFLDHFTAHLDAPGLYLLDEPETPLSPVRQLALLALLADAARAGAQLVVATHSPILLALPGARIYALDESGARETPYADLEHVRVTRDFLNAPERYLRHLG